MSPRTAAPGQRGAALGRAGARTVAQSAEVLL
jgi:hypothetical protein